MISFELDETIYEFDETQLRAFEAIAIKKHTGLPLTELLQGLVQGDPEALLGMVYIAKQRAGEHVKWETLTNIDLIPLLSSLKPVPTPAAA